jgi:hypothetical protein
MTIDQIISGLAGYVDTYHWPDELRLMNRLASEITTGNIVAIGSYRGQMDCALALNAQVPVFCVDPRNPGPTKTHYGPVDLLYWMQNVLAQGVADKVRPICLPSLDVSDIWWRPISLLLVDGDHDKAADDLDAWLCYVSDGALVAMHDSNFESVQRAVKPYIETGELVEIEHADVTVVYKRCYVDR